MARLGSLVIMRSFFLSLEPYELSICKSRMKMFMTPSGEGAKYAKYFPSGERIGDVFSGLPNRIDRGMSSSEVVREDEAAVVVEEVVAADKARRFVLREDAVAMAEDGWLIILLLREMEVVVEGRRKADARLGR